MGIKYSKDVVKLGFVDNSINRQSAYAEGGYPFGYFADTNLTKDQSLDLLQTKAEETLCNLMPPEFIDDIRVPSKNGTIYYDTDMSNTASSEDTNVEELTKPPTSINNNTFINAAILGVGIFLFFKLVD